MDAQDTGARAACEIRSPAIRPCGERPRRAG
jgi:hypothetical protein